MKTSEKILKYLREKQQASVSELVDFLQLSRMAVSKQLSNLLSSGEVAKIGKSPVVFYSINKEEKTEKKSAIFSKDIEKIIEENFLFITPSGQRKQGVEGFIYWCERTH